MIESTLNSCSAFGKHGTRGSFQDSLVVWEGFMEQRGCILGGVFDGHGNLGRQVALQIRDNLPVLLAESLDKVLDEEDGPSDFCHVAGEAMLRSFKQMERKLVTELKMKATTSGSTAIVTLVQAGQLLVANLGDSRCVLATTGIDGMLHAVQITEDLKPSLPGELDRILQKHGKVVSFPGNPPVDRIIHPEAGGNGLAVSRCFGDTMLKKFGLTAEPQLLYHRIRPEDRFLILASDGVWQVLTNEEAVQAVSSAASRKRAAEFLIEKACLSWEERRRGSQRDDMTVVVVYLEGLSSRLLHKLVSLKKSRPSTWQRLTSSWSKSSEDMPRRTCGSSSGRVASDGLEAIKGGEQPQR